MINTRISIDIQNQLTISDARNIYLNYLYSKCYKSKFNIFTNEYISNLSETQIVNIQKVLNWLEISDKDILVNSTARIQNYSNIAETLLRKNKAFVEDNCIKLYIDTNLIGKKFHDFIRKKDYYITSSCLNTFKNIILIDSYGCPSNYFSTVINDYINKITHIITDSYHFKDSIQEIIIRYLCNYPVVRYGHLDFFSHEKELLQLTDKTLALKNYIGHNNSEEFMHLFAISGWSAKDNYDPFNIAYTKEYLENKLLFDGNLEHKNTTFNKERIALYEKIYDQTVLLTP